MMRLSAWFPGMGKKSAKPVPVSFLLNPLHVFSLGFGSGLVPKAPGTAGTVVGALLYLPMQSLDVAPYLAVTLLCFLVGVGVCGFTASRLQTHDHPAIVWDEIVGYFATMAFAPDGWGWMLLGFVLFRFFDVVKPWPIRWVDRRVSGGSGIMLDDLLAGIFSAVIIQIIVYLL